MSAKLRRSRARGKNAVAGSGISVAGSGIKTRNQVIRIRNQISPVMRAVKAALPAAKAANHLAILIDEPLSNCQKLLAGVRDENAEVLIKLLRSEHGRDVLFAVMGTANPAWFSKYRKQLDANAARRQLEEVKRTIERLQAEAAE